MAKKKSGLHRRATSLAQLSSLVPLTPKEDAAHQGTHAHTQRNQKAERERDRKRETGRIIRN